MAIRSTYSKSGEIWTVFFRYASRQRQTNRHTYMLVLILCTGTRSEAIKFRLLLLFKVQVFFQQHLTGANNRIIV